jgi:hypothetical protein
MKSNRLNPSSLNLPLQILSHVTITTREKLNTISNSRPNPIGPQKSLPTTSLAISTQQLRHLPIRQARLSKETFLKKHRPLPEPMMECVSQRPSVFVKAGRLSSLNVLTATPST